MVFKLSDYVCKECGKRFEAWEKEKIRCPVCRGEAEKRPSAFSFVMKQ